MRHEARRGFRIVVHSRFDERVDPFLDAPTLCFDSTLLLPHIDLRLYNHTGNGVSGFHYDPVFLHRLQLRAGGQSAKKLKVRTDAGVGAEGIAPKSKLICLAFQNNKM